jgi:hypothetical protein
MWNFIKWFFMLDRPDDDEPEILLLGNNSVIDDNETDED